jgi:serine/threonine-protein kinase
VGHADLPPAADIVGHLIANRYLVEEQLEQSASSATQRAYHLALDRYVLLRILPARSGLTRDACRRALTLAERAATQPCPHVARTLDVGLIAGRWPFIVLEYSKGHSLEHLLAASGPLGPRRLLPIARQLADALAAAHTAGVCHGALTLDSVWVETPALGPDWLRTTGFGLSVLPTCEFEGPTSGVFASALRTADTAAGGIGLQPSAIRADIHALGVCLFELVSGARPLWSGSEVAAILDSDFAQPTWTAQRALTRAFATIIQRSLFLLPDSGYASALDLRGDIERLERAAQNMALEARSSAPPVTSVHAPAPIRQVRVGGPKVIVRGG